MSVKRSIPLTAIARRYSATIHAPERQRLEAAQALARDPASLAEEFAASIEQFEKGYSNPEPFFPRPRTPPAPEIARTEDIAWYLWKQATLQVHDAPALDAEYVDYEVVATRTTGRAVFDDDQGSSAKSALKLDLLLANHTDRTPIVAEVKRERDKDPFSALIQMLASVAHLATVTQYERMRTHFPNAKFADLDIPRLDGYVLLYRFGTGRSTYLADLLEQAQMISEGLMGRPEVTARLRRLACLDLELGRDGNLHASCRWGYS